MNNDSNRICAICGGGPGNDGVCLCGHKAYEKEPVASGDNLRADFLKTTLAGYIGSKCPGCGEVFSTLDSVREAVHWDSGRIGHQACFDNAQSSNASPSATEAGQ